MRPALLLPALFFAATTALAADAGVTVVVRPAAPLLEPSIEGQSLNFDFRVTNGTAERLEITTIEASVLTAGDALVAQRRVGPNGLSVLTVPERYLDPGATITVMNPLHTWPADLDLSRLRFEFVLDLADTGKERARVPVEVRPVAYAGKTRLVLPVVGRTLVHDGNEYYAHHRRLDPSGPMTTKMGITENPTRFGYDFCLVDEKGRMHRGDGSRLEDWYGFGAPILAPGDGTVVAAANDRKDKRPGDPPPFDLPALEKDMTLLYGNYAIVDHGNGEFSLLAHLKEGSVTVKPGDRVRRGAKIAEMGFSGDAFLVHLHYQVQRDAKTGEGLPSQFENFRRFTGKGWTKVARGPVDSGDVIESLAAPAGK